MQLVEKTLYIEWSTHELALNLGSMPKFYNFQAMLLPPLRPFSIACSIVKKDTEQPVREGRKTLKRAISPAHAVELV